MGATGRDEHKPHLLDRMHLQALNFDHLGHDAMLHGVQRQNRDLGSLIADVLDRLFDARFLNIDDRMIAGD